ncbi:biopolymer transporter ExbD [Ruficoccus sp. ZRK36]|uniref:ExbD/TolR family protein n=1 Tax=Ruficoccus sp. ZRK36 TaxID=2866311 RepID=UPI001C729E7E|nr:biopolymer transporter ExbD [Ruficoccus sp. ZRK36]QYY36836.1 biopolymer transporter ExbD [Ruficoccus sp. ZRK36]
MSKRKRVNALAEEDKTDLTPMIDVVFLLLAFFMVTTNFQEEADLGLKLPANLPPPKNVELPNEHVVDIEPSGDVFLNGAPMDNVNSRTMPELVSTLKRLKASADRGDIRTSVTIVASPASLHQRSIDVLNACASAQIKFVSFSAE